MDQDQAEQQCMGEGIKLSQEIEMGQSEHQHSQAGVLHVRRGQAEHLSAAKVREEQEI